MTEASVAEYEPRIDSREAAEALPLGVKSGRVVAIDALRGFDMIWILGAEGLARAVGNAFAGHRWADVLSVQMTHEDWEGIHFYDLIFPTFLFIIGTSLVYSLSKLISRGGRSAAVKRIVIRSIAMWAIGVFMYGGFSYYWPWLRLVGVLQRLAFCYLVAGLLFTFCSPRVMAIVTVVLLLGYWGLLTFVRMPNEAKVSFAEGHNIVNWFDARFLPGRKWDLKPIPHDPEGLLSTFPSICTCLLGVFAGLLLRGERPRPWQKAMLLIFGGAALTAIGYLWGDPHFDWRFRFPLIKKLWTSSYVLAAGGYSAMALGLFYLLMDVWGAGLPLWSRLRVPPLFVLLAQPFIWIGMNAILLYVVIDGNLIEVKEKLARRLVGGNISWSIEHHWGAQWPPVVLNAVTVLIVLLIARFLYKRQLFLRL